MFNSRSWTAAFINTLEREGGEIEEGIETLRILASWASSLPGTVFGRSAAKKLESLLRGGTAKAGVSSPAREAAIRFLLLMVRKNTLRHVDSVIAEAKKLLDRKNGIVQVTIEYAGDVSSGKLTGEDRIEKIIKERTGAVKVNITRQLNQELIGGYRLRMGDEIIDASVRSQLKKLETCLAAGDGEYGGDGWQITKN